MEARGRFERVDLTGQKQVSIYKQVDLSWWKQQVELSRWKQAGRLNGVGEFEWV